MNVSEILAGVRGYYDQKVNAHGPTAGGVDWNSPESQELRFAQLLNVCDMSKPLTIIDYGCGYGALVQYLRAKGRSFRYCGYDISEDMLARARALHNGQLNCEFVLDDAQLTPMDYTVASGLFNVRLTTGDREWKEYVLHVLNRINALSVKGFAFNMLTKYSDPARMRPDLYYVDPCWMFDHCKTRFSNWVALLHDYGLYEFTIIVRKNAGGV